MIISHNSFSYLPPRKWWMKLINWTSRCQNVMLREQAKRCDGFDLRVRFTRSGKCIVCHGLVDYAEFDTERFIRCFAFSPNKKVYCRVTLERDEHENDKLHFRYLCEWLERAFKPIIFFGGHRKSDWLLVYDFASNAEVEAIPTKQYISSMANDVRWYERLFPLLYAKRKNAENFANMDSEMFNYFDFI